jgi:hypothetical protein
MAALSNHSSFIKPFRWLLLSLLIKSLLYFIFIYNNTAPAKHFYGCFVEAVDHDEYIRPIDNYIDKGTYSLDGTSEPYAGRLPGFVFPYILFRALFDQNAALILLGIFILTLSILSSYTISLLMFQLTGKKWAFICAFLAMNFIPFYWYFDWSLHVNSLGVSCLVFFLYYIYNFFETNKTKSLIYAGFFIAWLALLRGFCLIWIFVAFIYLLYFHIRNKNSAKKIILSSFLFLMPFMVFETAWTIRNYISLHDFIPLQTSFVPGSKSKNPEYNTGMVTKNSMMSVRKLIFAWGGDNTWYFPNADMAWFVKERDPIIDNFEFDDKIFCEGLTQDSLAKLKSSIIYSFAAIHDKKTQDSIETVIETTAERYYANFLQHNKSYFYFRAPFKRLKHYLFRNPTQNWPGPSFSSGNILQQPFKVISVFEYALLLFLGLIFPVVYFLKRKSKNKKYHFSLIYILLLGNVLPFMYLILMSHYYYFIFGYVLLIPLFVFTVDLFQKSKHNG